MQEAWTLGERCVNEGRTPVYVLPPLTRVRLEGAEVKNWGWGWGVVAATSWRGQGGQHEGGSWVAVSWGQGVGIRQALALGNPTPRKGPCGSRVDRSLVGPWRGVWDFAEGQLQSPVRAGSRAAAGAQDKPRSEPNGSRPPRRCAQSGVAAKASEGSDQVARPLQVGRWVPLPTAACFSCKLQGLGERRLPHESLPGPSWCPAVTGPI